MPAAKGSARTPLGPKEDQFTKNSGLPKFAPLVACTSLRPKSDASGPLCQARKSSHACQIRWQHIIVVPDESRKLFLKELISREKESHDTFRVFDYNYMCRWCY